MFAAVAEEHWFEGAVAVVVAFAAAVVVVVDAVAAAAADVAGSRSSAAEQAEDDAVEEEPCSVAMSHTEIPSSVRYAWPCLPGMDASCACHWVGGTVVRCCCRKHSRARAQLAIAP